jgi:hypothetical protein
LGYRADSSYPAQADSIPRIIFDLPGAAEQIGNFQTSDFTFDIWELAQGYKRIASDTRLGLPRTLNQSLQKTPAGITSAASKLLKIKALDKALPGIAKGMTRIQEAKEMREQGKKIKMVITLGISEGFKKIVLVRTGLINIYLSITLFNIARRFRQCDWFTTHKKIS